MINEGNKAPEFLLPDQDGKMHSLKGYRGKKVVLYFYPKDFTPGCTKEACGFRDVYSEIQKAGAVVLGCSKDSVESHKKFAEKYHVNFPLLSDEKGEVIEKYGVWQKKSFLGKTFMGITRSTFLIDENGTIRKIWPRVRPDEHPQQILEAF